MAKRKGPEKKIYDAFPTAAIARKEAASMNRESVPRSMCPHGPGAVVRRTSTNGPRLKYGVFVNASCRIFV